jgi:hypothetical protein
VSGRVLLTLERVTTPSRWAIRLISSLMGLQTQPIARTLRRLVLRFFERSEFMLRGRVRAL